jgi:hypothetical protein
VKNTFCPEIAAPPCSTHGHKRKIHPLVYVSLVSNYVNAYFLVRYLFIFTGLRRRKWTNHIHLGVLVQMWCLWADECINQLHQEACHACCKRDQHGDKDQNQFAWTREFTHIKFLMYWVNYVSKVIIQFGLKVPYNIFYSTSHSWIWSKLRRRGPYVVRQELNSSETRCDKEWSRHSIIEICPITTYT